MEVDLNLAKELANILKKSIQEEKSASSAKDPHTERYLALPGLFNKTGNGQCGQSSMVEGKSMDSLTPFNVTCLSLLADGLSIFHSK